MPVIVCAMGYDVAAMRLQAKRTSLGHRTRTQFLKALQRRFAEGAPSDRLLGSLERGERGNYDDDTIRSVDLWYDLPPGTFAGWIGRDTPGTEVVDMAVSVPPAILPITAAGAVGEQGRLVDEERRMVGEAAELLAQAAAILAKIAAADD